MKKRFVLIMCISGILMTASACSMQQEPTLDALWDEAMQDAVYSDDNELCQLVSLTKDDDKVIWDDTGERVLLVTWHNYQDDCEEGESIEADGDIWATSLGEVQSWYSENSKGEKDWKLLFSQLLGVPEDGEYSRFSAFWISPEDVIRPAYVTDATEQMQNNYELVSGEWKEWFDANILYSYFESDYPWTRLGYTYDWSDSETDYGLTEFLIQDASKTEIAFTMTTEEFVDYLSDSE